MKHSATCNIRREVTQKTTLKDGKYSLQLLKGNQGPIIFNFKKSPLKVLYYYSAYIWGRAQTPEQFIS